MVDQFFLNPILDDLLILQNQTVNHPSLFTL